MPTCYDSVEISIDGDIEAPHHVLDLADIADDLVVDPSLDAEDYVQQSEILNLN